MTTKAKDGRETLQEVYPDCDPNCLCCDGGKRLPKRLHETKNKTAGGAPIYVCAECQAGKVQLPPLPVAEDVVESAKQAFADVLGTFHSTSCYPKALPIEIDVAAGLIVSRINAAGLLRQPEAAPEGLIRNAALQEAAAHLRDMGYWTQGAAVLSLCTDASTPAPASARSSATTTAPPVSLAECPVGLFTYRGTLCLKSEYGDNSGRIDAYIVSSGEFFWGGTQTASDQRKLFVTPAPDLLVSLQIAVGHIEHMAAFITTMNRKHNAGYSFESLGEDMPDIRSLLSAISGGRE